MRMRLIISAAIAAVATYSAIVRDARRPYVSDRRSPRTGRPASGPAPRQGYERVPSGDVQGGGEGVRPAAVADAHSREGHALPSTGSVPAPAPGTARSGETRAVHRTRRASARWQALPPVPPVESAHADDSPTTPSPVVPVGIDGDDPSTDVGHHGSADASMDIVRQDAPSPPETAVDESVAPRSPDVRPEPASSDRTDAYGVSSPASVDAPTDADEGQDSPSEPDAGLAHILTDEEAPAAEPVPTTAFSPVAVDAESAGTVVASGEFAISGTSHGPGQGTITAVTYRRPLDGVASSSDIRLEVNHAVNVAPQGLFVLGDEGFAPDGDGFVLMLLAAESGAFSARGTYRVYA